MTRAFRLLLSHPYRRIIDGMSVEGGLFSSLKGWLRKEPKAEDRRAVNRLPAHDPAQLSWRLASGEEKAAEANLIDISSLGFKVRCGEQIAVGTQVRLTDSMGQTADGCIVYSEKDEDAFVLGAQADWKRPATSASKGPNAAQPA